ncbi:class E sortase [Aquipuribacter sp. MA13-6]|uniref:class E sortase n=1 Tax=unclassified Aquipuribacter TaxID=2635084 RepID=UPI003EEA0F14
MIRALVRAFGELMVTGGALVLLFLAYQLWWTDVVGDRAQQQTAAALEQQWDTAAAPVEGAAAPAVDPVLADLPSDVVAMLRVPRFGEDYVAPVLAGTDDLVLQDGVGHYDGAALPGEVGNFAVAGHRTTWGAPFNPIADLVTGDAVVVETPDTFHVYRVEVTEIVLPTDVRVIAPVPSQPGETPSEAWLTMTSCHPMFSARERYVVHALLESSTPRGDGPPAALQAAEVG